MALDRVGPTSIHFANCQVEVCHAEDDERRVRPLLSEPASVAGASRRRLRWSAVGKWSMEPRSCRRSWVAMICAPAVRAAAFKKCCMR